MYLNEPNFLIRGCRVRLYSCQVMSQSDTNLSAKSSILQTSEIFTIVYTNAIDSVILDLQTKAVKMNTKQDYQAKNAVSYLPEVKSLVVFLIKRGRTENQIIAAVNGEYPYNKNTSLELFSLIHDIKNAG